MLTTDRSNATSIYLSIYLSIYIYVCVCAYNLIRWATFGFKKSRSRGKDEKLRQEKAKMRKKTKHWNRTKPPTKWGFFSWINVYYKIGGNWNFDLFLAHWLRLWPCIYIFSKSEIGEECRQFSTWILGVNFLRWPEALEKQGRKALGKNSP